VHPCNGADSARASGTAGYSLARHVAWATEGRGAPLLGPRESRAQKCFNAVGVHSLQADAKRSLLCGQSEPQLPQCSRTRKSNCSPPGAQESGATAVPIAMQQMLQNRIYCHNADDRHARLFAWGASVEAPSRVRERTIMPNNASNVNFVKLQARSRMFTTSCGLVTPSLL